MQWETSQLLANKKNTIVASWTTCPTLYFESFLSHVHRVQNDKQMLDMRQTVPTYKGQV